MGDAVEAGPRVVAVVVVVTVGDAVEPGPRDVVGVAVMSARLRLHLSRSQ